MLDKVKKHILLALLSLIIIYLGFTIYADSELVINSFASFNWFLIPILFLFTFLTHFTRFFIWHYYLKLLKLKVNKYDSFLIFFSSMVMAVTPGKLGEFLKSYSLKKQYDIPLSVSSPVIIAERITEFTALLIIAASGIFYFTMGVYIVISMIIIVSVIFILLSNKGNINSILVFLNKIKYLRKYVPAITGILEKSNILLKPTPFFTGIIINIVGWTFEFYAFHLIITSFNPDFSFFGSSFIFSFSIVIGAASMLPGGLGITDGSLGYLLTNFGISNDVAVAITIITRVVTLWFTILIGMVSLLVYSKRIGKLSSDNK